MSGARKAPRFVMFVRPCVAYTRSSGQREQKVTDSRRHEGEATVARTHACTGSLLALRATVPARKNPRAGLGARQ